MDLPLHPKIVHIPIALAVLMPLVSAGILFAWWRGWLQRRGWVIAVALQATLVIAGFLAMRSGEADEERVESVVAEEAIEAHEEAAEVFVWAGAGVLVVMLGAALLRREQLARTLAVLGTAGTVAVLWLGYRVGQEGGELVYHHGAASAWAPGGRDVPAAGEDAPRTGGGADEAPISQRDDEESDED